MQRLDARDVMRRMARALAWLAGGLLLTALAWLLSNLRDIDPVPRPAKLALSLPQLADEANAFFALAGLRAGPDREPAAVGQALWRLRLPDKAAPYGPVDIRAAQARSQAEREALGESLPPLPSLLCDSSHPDCTALWITQAAALAALRQPHTALGSRCEKLLGSGFEFEEHLPPTLTALGPFADHASGASQCSQWLLSGAVLAWAKGDRAQSVALFQQADRLNRSLLAGSRSLVGQMVALRYARNTLNTQTALAVRDPVMATALAPLMAPWPDPVRAVRRWMATEAAFQRSMLADAWRACHSIADIVGEDQLSWWEALEGRLGSLACRENIGLHPERTLAALDGMWLHKFAALDAGLPAAIALLAAERKAASDTGTLGALTWRNPVGSLLIAVAEPAYDNYLTRHADLELQREAAVLAVTAVAIAPQERTAWTAHQTFSPLAQGRLSWDIEGFSLTARTWRLEYAGAGSFNIERDAIRFTTPRH